MKQIKQNLTRYLTWVAGGFLLVTSFVTGYQISAHAMGDKLFISYEASETSKRGLATLQGRKEVLLLSRAIYTNPHSIFNRAHFQHQDGQLEVSIGNILFLDSKGNKNFICQSFPEVELSFEADGLYMRGESVDMVLTADCLMDSGHEFVGPYQIPVQNILNSNITSDTLFETPQGEIEFHNVALKWPRNWILREVTFKSDEDEYKVRAKIPTSEVDDFFSIEFHE